MPWRTGLIWHAPALPDLFAWYDPSDAATITETGGLVSLLADKTVNGRDLAASGTQRPTTGAATQNGLNVISMSNNSLVAASTTDWEVFNRGDTYTTLTIGVVRWTTLNNGNIYYFCGNNAGTTNSNGMGIFAQHISSEIKAVHDVSTGLGGAATFAVDNLSAAAAIAVNTWYIVAALHYGDFGAGATAANRSELIINNGTAIKNNTQTRSYNNGAGNNASHPFTIGRSAAGPGGNFPLIGEVGEVMISLDLDDYATLHAYLSAKWAI